jgi:hypothetical protein
MSARSSAPSFSIAAPSQILTINIDIGPHILEYHVHKATFCHLSAYFERAFMDSVSLNINADIAIFNIFIDWLHTGRLSSRANLGKDVLLKAIASGHHFTVPAF